MWYCTFEGIFGKTYEAYDLETAKDRAEGKMKCIKTLEQDYGMKQPRFDPVDLMYKSDTECH